ncbi:hypothetical protein NDU88_005867 [Pleurodeles waltl]|uniref:Uncharacterized protein n=1 Tax=Pleurodeles waltl TaxID=8319 RepID=A0AAV7NRS6_PLEWA|nr:hypothetical protein NDU88_005867 [Pleurodeles waltl]
MEGALEPIWRPRLSAFFTSGASEAAETPLPRRSAHIFGIPCTLRLGRVWRQHLACNGMRSTEGMKQMEDREVEALPDGRSQEKDLPSDGEQISMFSKVAESAVLKGGGESVRPKDAETYTLHEGNPQLGSQEQGRFPPLLTQGAFSKAPAKVPEVSKDGGDKF